MWHPVLLHAVYFYLSMFIISLVCVISLWLLLLFVFAILWLEQPSSLFLCICERALVAYSRRFHLLAASGDELALFFILKRRGGKRTMWCLWRVHNFSESRFAKCRENNLDSTILKLFRSDRFFLLFVFFFLLFPILNPFVNHFMCGHFCHLGAV